MEAFHSSIPSVVEGLADDHLAELIGGIAILVAIAILISDKTLAYDDPAANR